MSDLVQVGGKVAAAAVLAAGKPKAEAARVAGVSPRTVQRWSQDEQFRTLVTARRAEMLDHALGALADAAGEAVATLRASLRAEPSEARVTAARVGAARAILSMLVPLKEVLDLEERIGQLEARSGEGEP
ncbi:helix-turn-helix domain-containing protein [Actinomadura macra]|uniref:helix-turn-helix domain-containing protein n=1 Tax=Actinomadura macra TaxID=46164 RepID=UPI0008315AD5|nr:helix-turn-helix domain-containing protein [Actinomadura macra]